MASMKLQFRLRTLMTVVTLLAVPLGYVGWQAKIVRERKAVRTWIVETGGNLIRGLGEGELPWFRRVLGDESVGGVILPSGASRQRREWVKTAFREAAFTILPYMSYEVDNATIVAEQLKIR